MISVVFVTFNSAHCIRRSMQQVEVCLGSCNTVIVDNGSTDNTVEVARSSPEGGVRVLERDLNRGFGSAANLGVREAPDEAVLLLNPDVELTEAVEAPLGRFAGGVVHGLYGISLLNGRSHRAKLFRERPWWWDIWGQVLAPLWPREIAARPPTLPFGQRWVAGAGLLMNRTEFVDIGGFDERFFMYCEDRDLSRRYRAARLPLGGISTIQGRHALAASTAGLDGGAPARMAWSLLAWLEYVGLHTSEGEASLAAKALMKALAVSTSTASGVGRLRPASRFGVKARQIRDVRRYIDQWQAGALPSSDPVSDPCYYPLARQALSGYHQCPTPDRNSGR